MGILLAVDASLKTTLYSGLLATGGGLVFGASAGYVFALDSTTGHELWRVFLGGNTRAAPISFTVDGQQVIAVSAGGALFLFGLGEAERETAANRSSSEANLASRSK